MKDYSISLKIWIFFDITELTKVKIENEVNLLFCCPDYEDVRGVLFSQMSSIYIDFIWLDDYEKLELCFRKGTFLVADFICQAWDRRQNILIKTEL